MAKILQKKFELDRPDHDSHANRAERYWIKSMPFLLSAKLLSGNHTSLMDYN